MLSPNVIARNAFCDEAISSSMREIASPLRDLQRQWTRRMYHVD